MTVSLPTTEFFIGWDVGAWNCEKNSRSRDAIVILDSRNKIVGQPWGWKNLRQEIIAASTTGKWIRRLFTLCDADFPDGECRITMAIDTPLGFSIDFLNLASRLTSTTEPIADSATNPYLFRETERFLFRNGKTPLSAIKDMIGSQATKGMHVLSKFSPTISHCGAWTDGASLTVIESYPAACKGSALMQELRHHPPLGRDDIEDALTCALVALLFATNRQALVAPPESTPEKEGWIWVPHDALNLSE